MSEFSKLKRKLGKCICINEYFSKRNLLIVKKILGVVDVFQQGKSKQNSSRIEHEAPPTQNTVHAAEARARGLYD